MRLWSIHPKYLDAKGLVALWREGLLAQKVLKGDTTGYKQHPQLDRFKDMRDPQIGIRRYLHFVYLESQARGYQFDRSKIGVSRSQARIDVTRGQVEYETAHLLRKLAIRDGVRFLELKQLTRIAVHPMFTLTEGGVAGWEVENPR